jgi:ApbE superfamily uncharacterized protein (UPF0280 family)
MTGTGSRDTRHTRQGRVRVPVIRYHFQFRETVATILAEEQYYIDIARSALMDARQELEHYISGDPFFVSTLEPYPLDTGIQTVDRMSAAGVRAGVGPMAAVAGTLAMAGVIAMKDGGAEYAVIDNGGDIALVSDRPVRVGIYAGTAPVSRHTAFIVPPKKEVFGICTSSATVGPSISFGTADAVTVFSPDVALADAWATSLCNVISPDDTECLETVDPASVEGIFAVMGDRTFTWGHVPPVTAARVDDELITAGYLY